MGLVVGSIAKVIMKSGGGWLSTIAFGIAGGVVGGWIGDLIGHGGGMNLLSIWSWALSIGGAVLVITVFNAVTGRSARR